MPFSTCLAWTSCAESLRLRSRILRAKGSFDPLPTYGRCEHLSYWVGYWTFSQRPAPPLYPVCSEKCPCSRVEQILLTSCSSGHCGRGGTRQPQLVL